MRDGPDIARIASLLGDPARAAMLLALMDGRALTASELTSEAGVTKQTASAHLARLSEGGLVEATSQGRHRYFRLSGPDVAAVIESLIGLAERRGGRRTRIGPRDAALRQARVCYDHLAGDAGVWMLDRMIGLGWIARDAQGLSITDAGRAAATGQSVDIYALEAARRPLCRNCLDWSARRDHLAGSLGAALLDSMLRRGWCSRTSGSRVVAFSAAGERAFRRWLS